MNQITDYQSLQDAVAGTLHRPTDTTITGNVPLWIQLCESELKDELILKDMESEEPITLVIGQNYVALPTGYVSPIELWLVLNSRRSNPLSKANPEQLPYNPSNSIPQYYAIDGANVRFDCPSNDTYAGFFRIIKKSNLSNSTTTNPLLLSRPDVYLYGTLKQSAIFTQDDANLQKWTAMYEGAKQALKRSDARNRNQAPLRTELVRERTFNIYRGS